MVLFPKFFALLLSFFLCRKKDSMFICKFVRSRGWRFGWCSWFWRCVSKTMYFYQFVTRWVCVRSAATQEGIWRSIVPFLSRFTFARVCPWYWRGKPSSLREDFAMRAPELRKFTDSTTAMGFTFFGHLGSWLVFQIVFPRDKLSSPIETNQSSFPFQWKKEILVGTPVPGNLEKLSSCFLRAEFRRD